MVQKWVFRKKSFFTGWLKRKFDDKKLIMVVKINRVSLINDISLFKTIRGGRKQKGDNVNVVWTEFSTLSWVVLLHSSTRA